MHKYKNFSYVPFELATLYAAVDAHQTFRLKKVLERELKEENLYDLFFTIEMPLNRVLFEMEQQGIYLDIPFLQKLDKEIVKRLTAIEDEIIGIFKQWKSGEYVSAEGAVSGVIFGKLYAQKEILKGGEHAVENVFVIRHAAAQGSSANNARAQHHVVYVVSDHACHGGDE